MLTCCPMPGGSSAHAFAFSSPDSFSLSISLAIAVPTSQTVCARSNLSPPPCLPSLRPFVSPLSPLLALCLLFCLLALACSCCLAWFPLLLHRWKLLSFTVLKRLRKRVTTKESVRRLRGSVSQILISDLVRISSAPRSNLVKIAASQNPTRRGFGKALQWSAAWSAAAAAVVACAAASELVHFDHRCANRISTWRKIIDVWRKRCAMRPAQVLVNGVGSRRGSGQGCFARLIWH